MRFFCEKCDVPMELEKKDDLSTDSMKVAFRCPGCGIRVFMVTNQGETRLLDSLGLKIGSKEAPELVQTTKNVEKGDTLTWTTGAEARLNNAPSFIRPMAKMAIERIAGDKGVSVIDEALMDEAKGEFMEG